MAALTLRMQAGLSRSVSCTGVSSSSSRRNSCIRLSVAPSKSAYTTGYQQTVLSCSFLPRFRVEERPGRAFRGKVGQAGFATAAASVEHLKGAKEAISELIKTTSSNPILIRLGWHDAGTYDKNVSEWPKCGGANGSLFYDIVQKHGANAGLNNAVKLLGPIKAKYPSVSWADLFQMAGATAVELAGGPQINMKYGRVDVSSADEAVKEGNLPAAAPPSPAEHLRAVFYRMGLNDKDIVALSGAHTLGRAYPNRSGFGKETTKYTKDGPGTKGGQSWTAEWLKFDNSYFKDIKEKKDAELLVLPTDAALFDDAGFKTYAEKYAEDQDAFFADYAESHKKLSELGSKFDPAEGIHIGPVLAGAKA